MEKWESTEVDLASCPELILFKIVYEFNSVLFSDLGECFEEGIIANKNISMREGIKKNVEFASNLKRFGVKNPTKVTGKTIGVTEEYCNWFTNFFDYLRGLSTLEKEDMRHDIEIWKYDHHYDLSKWQPKTS